MSNYNILLEFTLKAVKGREQINLKSINALYFSVVII